MVGVEAAALFWVASGSPASLWAQGVDALAVALRAWLLAFWVSAAAAYPEVVGATDAPFPATPHDTWLTTVVFRAVLDTVSCHGVFPEDHLGFERQWI